MPDKLNGSTPGQEAVVLTPELERFVESMGLFYESYGVPRIGGRIIGLLLVSSEPMSAEQIATTLLISRGSVSTNLRTLGMLGLVDQVGIPGDRRDYFVFAPNAWDQATQARIQGMQGFQALGEQGLAALPPDSAARPHLEGMIRWAKAMQESDQHALERWKQGDRE